MTEPLGEFSVEGVAFGFEDVDREEGSAEAVVGAFEDDDFILGAAAGEAGFGGFAIAFAEDFEGAADFGGEFGFGLGVDEFEEVLVAGFFDGFGELEGFREIGGGGAAAGAVAEDEGVVEVDGADDFFGGLVVGFGFSGEADDDIGGDREVGAGLAHALADVQKALRGVGPVHRFEDGGAAALQVDVRAELGEALESFDEVGAVADGVGAGEADAVEAVEVVELVEELHEGAATVEGGESFDAVAVNDLAEEGDFFDALGDEAADFVDDFGDGSRAFFAAGVGDDAEGAFHIAALHDANEGGGLARRNGLVADSVLAVGFFGDVDDAEALVVHAAFQSFG